jgi:2-octaprenyl-6-methoxyphenol hydroxylase
MWEFESPRGHHTLIFMKNPSSSNELHTSVIILGAGLVGAFLANFLKKSSIPFILIDPLNPEKMVEAVIDGRTTAISFGSSCIFKRCGLWEGKINNNAQPIDSIRVVEKDSISVLDFNAKDVGDNPIGYIVQNRFIREALLENLANDKNCFFNTSVTSVTKEESSVSVLASNGITIKGPLLVSAEGRNSPSRDLIGPKKKTKDYAQKALVVHLEHEEAHQSRAWEVFTPDGPFAMLPLKDGANKQSGIVYAKPITFNWDGLTDAELARSIQEFFPYYGHLKVVSKRWFFPLSVFEVDTITGHRQVLVGDAAHVMHPLAGQGVNLGWRDIDILAQQICKLYKLGIDIGHETYLKEYEAARKRDTKHLVTATDLLNSLFQHPSKTLYYVRNFGLSIVNNLPPLKRFFMKKAMGL